MMCASARAGEDPVTLLVKKGDTFDRELKTSEALAAYLEAEKLSADDAEIDAKIAKQLADSAADLSSRSAQKERIEEALRYSLKAVKAKPDLAIAHLSLAICYGKLYFYADNEEKMELSRKVKVEIERSLELDPSSDAAYHILGRWHYEVANLNPVLMAMATTLYGGLPKASNEAAIGSFKKAIAISPNRAMHHIELGRAYAAAGKKDLAKASIERGLSMPSREKEDPAAKVRGRKTLENLE